MLLYYITDRSQFPGNEAERRHSLLKKIGEAARWGVDLVQLREKDLLPRELELLAREAVRIFHLNQNGTQNRKAATGFLINSRSDVALACGADGVHLRSDDLSPVAVRSLWKSRARTPVPTNLGQPAIIGVSCHSRAEVAHAASDGADFVVFAPVFEKKTQADSHPAGLDALRQACQEGIPVLALGGVTLANAHSCLEAGAAGIAGIRLFQENDITTVVQTLRELSPHTGS